MQKHHELFARLNAARVANGKNPLKAWKESNTSLLNAIRKEEGAAVIEDVTGIKTADVKKEVKKAKLVKKAPKTTTTEFKTVSEVFATLNVNPKVGRARLRKQYGKAWRDMSPGEVFDALTAPKGY